MIGFEYKYTTSTDIFTSIKLITEYSLFEYIILITSILFLILIIYYIIPIINIYLDIKQKERKKEERKRFIKQIALQKDINDIIEKELDL